MKIGYCSDNYATRRNIICKVRHYDYRKVYNDRFLFISYFNKVSNKLFKKPIFNLTDSAYKFNNYRFLFNIDLIHLFNTISNSKKNWIVTFETVLPRNIISHKLLNQGSLNCLSLEEQKAVRKELYSLTKNSCKKLISLSNCNLKMQKDILKHFPEYSSKILPKLTCLHPPQKVIVENWVDKNITLDQTINFIFVGGLFFIKGGKEVLEVFTELKQCKNVDIKLTIISSLTTDDYFTKTTEVDKQEALSIIKSNSDWIDFYDYLPNAIVLNKMKEAHVGLLPTFADTYGYVVLELQACGCPVITTNVRALPEINNEKKGWLINLPINQFGLIDSSTEALIQTKKQIKLELKNIVKEIIDDKNLIINKANSSIDNVRVNHSPELFGKKLKKIYESI